VLAYAILPYISRPKSKQKLYNVAYVATDVELRSAAERVYSPLGMVWVTLKKTVKERGKQSSAQS
jgi:hypothetical protein